MSFITTKINDCLYEFTELSKFTEDGALMPYVDAYLLIGEERAVLIDALQYTQELYPEVRKYTDLPLDVLITHGHGDHAGEAIPEFAKVGCKIYMRLADYENLYSMSPFIKKEWLVDIGDGDIYDLGGRTLEAIWCGGHTQGCVAFLDRASGLLFSGDTIGSGSFWMQLPCSLPMDRFRENLYHLWNQVKDIQELLIYPGHRNQSPVQLTQQYIQDCMFIADGLVKGAIEGEEKTLDMADRHMVFRSVAHGQMLDFCYDAENIYAAKA